MHNIMTHKDGSLPTEDEIFVFGSNLAGRHGAGAAKAAFEKFGAVYGLGSGPAGMSYAIPTKDSNIQTIPLSIIKLYVEQFFEHTEFDRQANLEYPEDVKQFFLTRVGCGLAGYTDEQIAPIFAHAFISLAPGVKLNIPEEWLPYFQEA